jgi:hypothetical protein
MTFKNFIQSARVTETPRGNFIADMKTLINAGVFPAVEMFGWNDFYSFMAYHHRTSPEAIEMARKVWREFKAKNSEIA